MLLRTSLLASAILALATSTAFAAPADNGKHLTAQQQRMVDCNKTGKGKKGDEYRSFMKSCLSGKNSSSSKSAAANSSAAASTDAAADKSDSQADRKLSPRERMKSCSADAKTKSLKGADRRTFMSSCLKG